MSVRKLRLQAVTFPMSQQKRVPLMGIGHELPDPRDTSAPAWTIAPQPRPDVVPPKEGIWGEIILLHTGPETHP